MSILPTRTIGKGREQDAEALNTRLSRWAQVIAMDGMYAGFAGAKTGHGRMAFSGCGKFRRRDGGIPAYVAILFTA